MKLWVNEAASTDSKVRLFLKYDKRAIQPFNSQWRHAESDAISKQIPSSFGLKEYMYLAQGSHIVIMYNAKIL